MSEAVNIPQLRFPEFREEWKIVKLTDIVDVMTDYVAAGSFESLRNNVTVYDKPNYAIYLRLTDLRKGIYHKDLKYVDRSSYDFLNKSNLCGGEILMANIGANVGDTYLMPVIDDFATIAPNMIVIKENRLEFLSAFLFYWLNTRKGEKSINTAISGSGQPKINKTDLKQIKISLTSQLEQAKIASFLTAVDNKIEQLSKKQELLGEYKKGVMQQIFSQVTRFKADDGSDFPDWEDGLLNTLIDNSRKIRYGIVQPGKYDKNGKYLIRGKDYSNGWEIPSEFFKVSDAIEKKYSKTRVKKGDVIVCIVGSVGNVMVIPGWLDGANITQTTARIAPDKNKLNNQYLYFYFQSLVGRNMIHKHTRVGTRPGLNIEDVEKFSILLPSLLEQAKIANFLSSIDNKIEQVGKQLDESKQFKKALLQQMFV